MQKAIFAAGCFWGVEASFKKLPGVSKTSVGYTGGHKVDPTYEEVCRTDTGHAEAVEVDFDPVEISFEELVTHFFGMHDPTTVNRQGPDVGAQYRSAIYVIDNSQREIAEKVKARLDLEKQFASAIVTEITDASKFYRAEEYHQNYLEKQGGTCHL